LAKSRCCIEVPKPAHRIVALFHSSVILLDTVVKVTVRPMRHLTAEYSADGSRVGVVAISRHLFWSATGHFLGLLEELLGRRHISLLTQHAVHQVAVPVNGPKQVVPLAGHLDVRLVGVPRAASLAFAFAA